MKRKVLLIIFALALMLACAATVSFANTDTGTDGSGTGAGISGGAGTGTGDSSASTNIEFTVDGAAATVENTLTIKESPTYGDTWADIVKIKEGVTIVAKVAGDDSNTGDNDGTGNTGGADGAGNVSNTDSEQSHFTLKQTGTPSAGDNQDWELVYSGTIGEQTYTDVTVLSGKVNVAKRLITYEDAAAYNRPYDGTNIINLNMYKGGINCHGYANDIFKGTLSFTRPESGTVDDMNASTEPKLVKGLTLIASGMAKDNYDIVTDIDYVYVIISKADPDVGTVTHDDTQTIYTSTALSAVKFVKTGTAEGTISLDAGQVLEAGTNEYTWTFTPADTTNYNTATGTISLTVTQARHSSGGGSASKSNSEVEKAKTEAKAEVKTEAEASKYDAKEASEVAAIQEQAEKDIADAKTVEEVKAIEAEAQAKIEAVLTTEEKAEIKTVKSVDKAVFKAKSTNSKLNGKKAVKITWSVPSKVDVDGFEIYRSEKKNSGYGTKPYFTTSKTSYTNNKELKAGTTYYYKVRAYKVINGEKVYTGWSTKAYRTI